MMIYLITSIKFECYKGKPELRPNYQKYYDDCRIKTYSGNLFRLVLYSEDELFNELSREPSKGDLLLFNNSVYNQNYNCSKVSISMKNVVDRLIKKYPDKVRVAENCGTVPKYPLKIDSLESSIAGTKIQLKINVSGDLPGRAQIIWGSLASSEIVNIDPAAVRSVTYEKSMSPGTYTVCVSEVN